MRLAAHPIALMSGHGANATSAEAVETVAMLHSQTSSRIVLVADRREKTVRPESAIRRFRLARVPAATARPPAAR